MCCVKELLVTEDMDSWISILIRQILKFVHVYCFANILMQQISREKIKGVLFGQSDQSR